MKCPNCAHDLEVVGVSQLATICGLPPGRMSERVLKKGFPDPDGSLGARRDFWLLERIRPRLSELGLLKEKT